MDVHGQGGGQKASRGDLASRSASLCASSTSPFVRRVRYALDRLGLGYDLRPVEALFPPPDWFLEISPLGLIPVLTVEGEAPVVESSLILDFIDERMGPVWEIGPRLRWEQKRQSMLLSGGKLRAVQWRLESLQAVRRAAFEDDCARTLELTLRFAERFILPKDSSDSGSCLTQPLADMAILLDYIEYRHGEFGWQVRFPRLSGWHIQVRDAPLLQRSAPPPQS